MTTKSHTVVQSWMGQVIPVRMLGFLSSATYTHVARSSSDCSLQTSQLSAESRGCKPDGSCYTLGSKRNLQARTWQLTVLDGAGGVDSMHSAV